MQHPDPPASPAQGEEPRRDLVGSAYVDDDGAADPALARMLGEWARGEREYRDVLGLLAAGRVLVPVVAVADEVEVDAAGLVRDKSSDMAAVLLRRPDGRTGLLCFTGLGPLAAWDAAARPVPVSLADAARSAVQDGAVALVLDVAGPVQLVVGEPDLRPLAAGWTPVRLEDGGWGWLGEDRDSDGSGAD